MKTEITKRIRGRNLWSRAGLVLTIALTLASWGGEARAATPSALLHNSVNTTLNPSSMKWSAAGGWGVAGGQYGEFTCSTCHAQGTGNISRIKNLITVPDTSKGNIPGSTVAFASKSDFGTYSSNGYTSSVHICEVCHTQTAYHKYSQTKVKHEDAVGIKDCTVCHRHDQGFRPAGGCLICHSKRMGNRAAVADMFGGNSHHVQGVAISDKHCYQCHWEANADGSINGTYHGGGANPGAPIRLVIYGAGARPTTFTEGTTGISYTANGSRTEIAKVTTHCLGCHSAPNNAIQPFGDGKTPNTYAWDKAKSAIGTRYSDTGTTPWGKYSGTNITPKNTRTKAFSAHGNAVSNQGGFDLTETWTDRKATANVMCFDCHNSHGSTVAGTTTSYQSATVNGGIMKDTTAGIGGYAVTYKPGGGGSTTNHNAYNAGAGLCFDCHMVAAAGVAPWGYNGTFGSTQQIMNYFDTPYFGPGTFNTTKRYSYKSQPNLGGHFGASSALSSVPQHQIGGLCTPCHDPHGVSPDLGTNKQYAVPLLKGTWLTSVYKEDVATADNQNYEGGSRRNYGPTPSAAYDAATNNSYHIDQNTFTSTVKNISETDTQFGGLCLGCHLKTDLTNGTTNTWKDKNRIHQSVKGWKTANTIIQHSYACSKCHAAHNSNLPRLMVTNCLDYKHRGRVTNLSNPVTSGSNSGRRGSGSGSMPGKFTSGGDNGDRSGWGHTTSSNTSSVGSCHSANDPNQQWNTKTPWTSGTATSVGGSTSGGSTFGR